MKERSSEDGVARPHRRIIITLPEQDLEISEVEHAHYRPFEQSEFMLRLLTGTTMQEPPVQGFPPSPFQFQPEII